MSAAFNQCNTKNLMLGSDLFNTPQIFEILVEQYGRSISIAQQIEVSKGRIFPTHAMQCPGSQGLYVYTSDVQYQGFKVANSVTGAIACHPRFPDIVNALELVHYSERVIGFDFHTFFMEGWPITTTQIYPGYDPVNDVYFTNPNEPNMAKLTDNCLSNTNCQPDAAISPDHAKKLTKQACEAVFAISADIPESARDAATRIMQGYMNIGLGYHMIRLQGILNVSYDVYLPSAGCTTIMNAHDYQLHLQDPMSDFIIEQWPLFAQLPQDKEEELVSVYFSKYNQWPTSVNFTVNLTIDDA